MAWLKDQPPKWKRHRTWVVSLGCCLCMLIFLTPKVPHSPRFHLYADKRNFLGVPNTLNVITNFPFLIVGVLGFVLCLQGSFFVISLKGEAVGWTLFYLGIAGVAFGSAYYHIKPDDTRLMWDTLPMTISYSALLSCLLVERVGIRTGIACLIPLLGLAFLCTCYERTLDDLRLCMIFQLIPCVIIPMVTFFYPSKYTHSRYWLWSAGAYVLARFEAVADQKIYRANHYVISGHSLGHLCLVMVPILLSIMLTFRSLKFQRLGDLKECL
uniref:Ceramidase n=1 Tax=Kalanchoe fedtschenkoi TaxID=63787 RepID=A0A7N0VCP5_KALFE